jgi:antibiotic biosynthesis monooxygenase (ABM) superfamily enzyme
MKQPPKWKMALLIWLGIYPIITLLVFLLFPYMAAHNWPLPLRTLLLTLIAVPLMTYGALPLLQKWLKSWLQR